jgi:hypothetical protein
MLDPNLDPDSDPYQINLATQPCKKELPDNCCNSPDEVIADYFFFLRSVLS